LNFDELCIEEDNENENEDDNNNENTKSVKNVDVVLDYKKASLNKLKSLVVERGLVKDASKLKKSELLKMLD